MADEILYKKLGYEIAGAAIAARKAFGLGHKEQIYQKALEEKFIKRGLSYVREPAIKILSPASNKFMGLYRPDFLIENKIVVEIKALPLLTKSVWDQVYQYLRSSECELAYVINFSPKSMTLKRVICTNDRKYKKGWDGQV